MLKGRDHNEGPREHGILHLQSWEVDLNFRSRALIWLSRQSSLTENISAKLLLKKKNWTPQIINTCRILDWYKSREWLLVRGHRGGSGFPVSRCFVPSELDYLNTLLGTMIYLDSTVSFYVAISKFLPSWSNSSWICIVLQSELQQHVKSDTLSLCMINKNMAENETSTGFSLLHKCICEQHFLLPPKKVW